MSDPSSTPTPQPTTQPDPPRPRIAVPTWEDPDVAAASQLIGGQVGTRALLGMSFWTPIRVAIVVATAGYAIAVGLRLPCVADGFAGSSRYTHMCYSDIPVLFSLRGFADGYLPYLDTAAGQEVFEYPVLTGLMAQIAAWLTPLFGGGPIGFYAANLVLIAGLLILTVVATGLTNPQRPTDAILVAASPALLLPAAINWDMLPVALVALSLLLWSRKVVFWSGVVLGLAIAAKFYPVILLGPLVVLCLRAGQLKAFGRMFAGVVLAWLVANVPVMLVNFDGWATFYTFSSDRGQDFGSPWLALSIAGFNIPPDAINLVGTGTFALLCLAIAGLIWWAPVRPRLAPMLFLVLAAFLLTNKVYSPQYMMWLVPLAVLSLPRVRYLAAWQAGELIYYAAIWLYLAGLEEPNRGLPQGWYALAIWIHIGLTVWFAGVLIRNTLRPDRDPVRNTDKYISDDGSGDDPGGGVLNRAADSPLVTRRQSGPRHASSMP